MSTGGRGGGGGGGGRGQRHRGGLTVEARHEWLCLQCPEGTSQALSHLAEGAEQIEVYITPYRTHPRL